MPGHLLRRCQQIAVALFLERVSVDDLTPIQFALLSALDQHEGLDQAKLAGLAALDRTNVGSTLSRLEHRGLVTRQADPNDRRCRRITVTAAGRDVVATAWPDVKAVQSELLAPLSEEEGRVFVGLLNKIATHRNDASRAPARALEQDGQASHAP